MTGPRWTAAPASRRGGRSACRDRGAAAVEFAIVLPILLVMIFGVIDFGRLVNAEMTLNEASREAARALAFGQDPLARAKLVTGDSTTTVNASTSCASPSTAGSTATVTLRNTFTFITPIMALLNNSATTRSITSTGVMACIG